MVFFLKIPKFGATQKNKNSPQSDIRKKSAISLPKSTTKTTHIASSISIPHITTSAKWRFPIYSFTSFRSSTPAKEPCNRATNLRVNELSDFPYRTFGFPVPGDSSDDGCSSFGSPLLLVEATSFIVADAIWGKGVDPGCVRCVRGEARAAYENGRRMFGDWFHWGGPIGCKLVLIFNARHLVFGVFGEWIGWQRVKRLEKQERRGGCGAAGCRPAESFYLTQLGLVFK